MTEQDLLIRALIRQREAAMNANAQAEAAIGVLQDKLLGMQKRIDELTPKEPPDPPPDKPSPDPEQARH